MIFKDWKVMSEVILKDAKEVQRAFGQHSQKYGLILGWCGLLWRQELDTVIFVGPFQVGICYNSKKSHLWRGFK